MIEDAARNVKLEANALSLLALYADCAEGFAPALKTIQDRTGISRDHVSRIRGQLHDRALIAYDRDARLIVVRWANIRAFAMLEEPIEDARKSYFNSGKHAIEWATRRKIKDLPEYRMYRIAETAPLTEGQKATFHMLENMTEDQFIKWVSGESVD